MGNHQLDEEAIFHTARKIENAEARREYLDQICVGDQALLERVQTLLDVHEKEQEFLKSTHDPRPTEEHATITEGPGTEIGRYKLLQKIGEGGFGIVYMAEQHRPIRRKVALKIIKPGMDTAAVVARFEAERQALALMDHPNIAHVLDGGTTDSGRPFFVMELVKGVPITEYCDKTCISPSERLILLTTVCEAVQHAHQKGIIHRDLKPSNIMITLHDGKPIVKVIDFGVSKAINQQLTEKTLFTAYGQLIGTPQYMSPEQAEMSGLDIDTRSDIYSLGVLMYELLVGTTPLDAERLRHTAFAELQRVICEEEAQRLSTRLSMLDKSTATRVATQRGVDLDVLRRYLRDDLEWIVMKALSKDRNRRYATPGDLADDVNRFLNDEAIEARPPSKAYAFRKFAKRNKYAVGTVVAVALSLLVGLVGTVYWMNEAREENALRKKQLYFSDISLAYQLWEENNFRRVEQILEEYRSPEGTDYRGLEWYQLWKATERRRNAAVIPCNDIPQIVRFLPDGESFIVGGWDGFVKRHQLGNPKNAVVVIDKSIGRERLTRWGQANGWFAGSGSGPVSWIGYWQGDTAVLQSLLTGKEIELHGTSSNSSFASDPENRRVAVCGKEQSALVLEANSGRQVAVLPEDAKTTGALAISSDGRLLATSREGRIVIWDTEKGTVYKELETGKRTARRLVFSPDGGQLAAGYERAPIKAEVWNTNDGTVVATIADHSDAVRSIAYSPDGRLLATGSRDNSIKLWETTSFELVDVLRGHSGIVNSVTFSPNGKYLASASQDYTVVLWNVEDIVTRKTLPVSLYNPQLIDSRAMYLENGEIREVDLAKGESLAPAVTSDHSVDLFTVAPDGSVAIAYDNGD